MKYFSALLMAGVIGFSTSAIASEVKIAMNGKEDIESNSEQAFNIGFRDYVAKHGMTVKIFPSNSIGKEKERLDQVAQGLIQINLATTSTPASMSPIIKGLGMPFFFKNSDELEAALAKSDLMERMNKGLLKNGVRLVGFNMRGLEAGIYNSKRAVTNLKDFQGIRMRAMNKGQLSFYKILGVHATIVSWAEVANALQTGIVEGYMNPPNSALRTGHTQYLKYFTDARLLPSPRAILISEDWYSGLSEKDRKIVDGGIKAGIAANRQWVIDWSKKVDQKFKEAGVTVSTLSDGERERFAALSAKIYGEIVNQEDLAAFKAAVAMVRK